MRALTALALALLAACSTPPDPAAQPEPSSGHVFTVEGDQTLLDGEPFLAKGLRLSNALVNESATEQLIENLETFQSYGVNTVSVFLMGSRFGDVKGYREDASLDPVYADRLGRIIQAADARRMVVLVGCLYWGNSEAKWKSWTQQDAEEAVAETIAWLRDNNYRNVFVDVDNEGMARREKGFDTAGLIAAGKAVDPSFLIASNFKGPAPEQADLAIHFSERAPGKPYIETEGSPEGFRYWPDYSRTPDGTDYINKGVYTDEMKRKQIETTREHLSRGDGYLFASTWLQDPPPEGPHQYPGGMGTAEDPGVRWWLEMLHDEFGGD